MIMNAPAPSLICDALPAVTDSPGGNAGLSLPSDSGVESGLGPSSTEMMLVLPFRPLGEDGNNFEVKPAFSRCYAGQLVRSRREFVLFSAAYVILGRDDLGGAGHVPVFEWAPQSIVDHRVGQLRVSETLTGPAVNQ